VAQTPQAVPLTIGKAHRATSQLRMWRGLPVPTAGGTGGPRRY
jgi:hypothetical protein